MYDVKSEKSGLELREDENEHEKHEQHYEGPWEVTDVAPLDSASRGQVLKLAAAVEGSRSTAGSGYYSESRA